MTKQEYIEQCTVGFYRELFTAQEDLDPQPILQAIPVKVTEAMNEYLCRPYTAEEVKKALFMMGLNKSPGLDGFTAGVYQTYWELVGDSVTRAVLQLLNDGFIDEEVNSTTIVLIPKIKQPQEMKQFQPISLCNVIYKICSKVLANRMRVFIAEIISEEQSAFVPRRLITNNVLMAYECIHYLKRKKGKSGTCAVKLDMAKAYDCVEWRYLKELISRLGFAEAFTLLCVEGLSSLLKSRGLVHLSRGVRVSTLSPWILHLLFADDCIIFSEASERGAKRLKEILETYHQGSRQLVNYDKSAVFFSKNNTEVMKEQVLDVLQIGNEVLAERYLGLPKRLADQLKILLNTCHKKLEALWGVDQEKKQAIRAVKSYSSQKSRLSQHIQ